jgi:hypothetical protein
MFGISSRPAAGDSRLESPGTPVGCFESQLEFELWPRGPLVSPMGHDTNHADCLKLYVPVRGPITSTKFGVNL